MEKERLHYETDLLIVGGGSAGLWAAHAAAEKDKNLKIMIVEKGEKNWGGNMVCSGGDLQVVMPGEDVGDWVKDQVYYNDGLCDQDMLEALYAQTYDRFQDYLKWGCEYLQDENGNYSGIKQRSMEHVKLYVTKEKGNGGTNICNALNKQVTKAGITAMGRVMLTDLMKDNTGKIIGAVGFQVIDGTFVVIKAKAVLLATNCGGIKGSYMGNMNTGEGIQMAFEAGAEIRNMEFCRVWNVPVLFAWEGQTTLLPLGARFMNAQGEDIMERYSPVLGGNTDPHYNVVAMALEARAGRAPFYFDTTKLDQKKAAAFVPKSGWQGLNYRRLKEDCGIDMFQQKTEWMPQMIGLVGGIVADVNGATRVPGLYAAGWCHSIDAGVYSGGLGLSLSAAGGYLAGKAAATYIADLKEYDGNLDENYIAGLKEKVYRPMRINGIKYKEVLTALRSIVSSYDVCILKSEASLQNALNKLENLKRDVLPYMAAEDAHFLAKGREVQAIAFGIEWFLKTSLMRKESRAGHYREDYPHRDDNWLKWIVIGLENGEAKVHTEDVPLETYKHPVEKYYQDNFTFIKK